MGEIYDYIFQPHSPVSFNTLPINTTNTTKNDAKTHASRLRAIDRQQGTSRLLIRIRRPDVRVERSDELGTSDSDGDSVVHVDDPDALAISSPPKYDRIGRSHSR